MPPGDEPTSPFDATLPPRPCSPTDATMMLGAGFPVHTPLPGSPPATDPMTGSPVHVITVSTVRNTRLPHIPGYELLGELGRGGMGVVYRAKQQKLNRLVALKMLLHADVAEMADVVRFRSEAEAVAAVRHPNVVQVYDSGQHDGRPYFAMEFLSGGNLYARLKASAPFAPEDAAALVEKLARAVHAAHSQGIVHRDLKPGNVLFDAAGEPRVTDFGLAKRTSCELTRTQAVMGTPAYMPPEQAAGRAKFAGPPADIYALGVILYECLAGKPPFQNENSLHLMNQVIHDAPPSVRSKVPATPRDLELICLKCLEKEQNHRYPTAAALADDLRHFLNAEPVSVRPAGLVERTYKWAKRRPTLAATYGLALLVLFLAVFGGSAVLLLWQATQARDAADIHALAADRARDDAEEHQKNAEKAKVLAESMKEDAVRVQGELRVEKQNALKTSHDLREEKEKLVRAQTELERVRYFHNVASAHQEAKNRNYLRAIQLLDDCPDALRRWEWWHANGEVHKDIGSGHCTWFPIDAAFNPNGYDVLAAQWPDGGLVSWFHFATGKRDDRGFEKGKQIGAMRLSANGKRAVTVRLADKQYPDGVEVWDLATRKRIAAWPSERAMPLVLAISDDGGRVVCGFHGFPVRGYDVTSGKPLPESAVKLDQFPGFYPTANLSGTGAWAAIPHGNEVALLNTQTGEAAKRVRPQSGLPTVAAVSPQGTVVVVGTQLGEVSLHDTAKGVIRTIPHGHVGEVTASAASPNGAHLATAGEDGVVRVWRVSDGVMVREWMGHFGRVGAVRFDQTGNKLVSADHNGFFYVWSMTDYNRVVFSPFVPAGVTGQVYTHPTEIGSIALGDSAFAWRHAVKEAVARPIAAPNGERFAAHAFRPGSEQVALGGSLGTVQLHTSPWGHTLTQASVGGGTVAVMAPPPPVTLGRLNGSIGSISFTPDGKRLLAASTSELGVWDVSTGKRVFAETLYRSETAAALSDDGRWLAASTGVSVVVYDLARRVLETPFAAVAGSPSGVNVPVELYAVVKVSAVGFTPDSQRVLVATRDWKINVCEIKPPEGGVMRPLYQYVGHTAAVRTLMFNANGSRLVSGAEDGSVKVWDPITRLEAIGLHTGHRSPVTHLEFSPDGAIIFATSQGAKPTLFDGSAGHKTFRPSLKTR